jgi:hypothetical protein
MSRSEYLGFLGLDVLVIWPDWRFKATRARTVTPVAREAAETSAASLPRSRKHLFSDIMPLFPGEPNRASSLKLAVHPTTANAAMVAGARRGCIE